MERLINANELLKKIREAIAEPDYMHEGEDWQVGLTIAERLVEEAEPKNGHWIQLMDYDIDSNAVFECSVCGGSDTHAMGVEVPYCWHCGARMEADHD